MSGTSSVLGKQDNQNAAAFSPEVGINKLLERTKCTIVQENGQRRYGPPANWKREHPQRGCEVFIGKIPRDCFEDELIPVFERIGPIYMFRLMMEFTGSNRGYGFCVYTNREDAKRAVHELDNHEIRKGKTIGVCFSVDNCRLFVGGIPKIKTKEEIMLEMKRVTEGVKDVIAYPSINDKSKNRGFAFVEYENHKAAAMARRKLLPGRIQLWGQQIAVDWAEPEKEVNEDIMMKVKILYVRNLMLSTTEEELREHFVRVAGGDPNCIERVKKISDYAFVHFKEREQADKCLQSLNDTIIEGSRIEVTWAKPADKTDTNPRQQTSRNRLTGDFSINKDLNNNAMVTATGLISAMETAPPFLISSIGQHQTLTPELLSINPSAVNAAVGSVGIVNSGTRLSGPRMGRRNAAGSRSAGVQRDRKHPVEKFQQRQPNPLMSFGVLEEIARHSGWGTPLYSASMVEMFNSFSAYKVPVYVGQVLLPNLHVQYSSTRGYPTPEEAKAGACEAALQNLCYHQLLLETAYAAIVNNNLMPSGAPYLPLALQGAGGAGSLGVLPQLISNQTSLPNQSTNQPPSITLPSNLQPLSDCTAITGFDYYPGTLSSFTNPSAYYVEPLLLTSNTNLSGLSPAVLDNKNGMSAAPNSNMFDLASTPLSLPSAASSVVGSAAQLSHPGLYTLGLPVSTVTTQLIQQPNVCSQQPASLMGLFAHPQQVASNTKPVATVSVSLANTQSVSVKKSSQLSLPIAAHV